MRGVGEGSGWLNLDATPIWLALTAALAEISGGLLRSEDGWPSAPTAAAAITKKISPRRLIESVGDRLFRSLNGGLAPLGAVAAPVVGLPPPFLSTTLPEQMLVAGVEGSFESEHVAALLALLEGECGEGDCCVMHWLAEMDFFIRGFGTGREVIASGG